MMNLSRIAAALALTAFALPAAAQEGSAWSINGIIGVASDYTWHGVSQTQEDPTWQLEVNLEHETGFYVGGQFWGVDFVPPGEDWDDGISYEANLYLGWSRELSEFLTLTLDYTRTFYPGSKPDFDQDFNEFSVELGLGENVTALVTWSDDAVNLGHEGLYLGLSGSWELGESGFQLGAAAGRYDLGSELGGAYNDYEVSLSRSFGSIATKLAYVTTSGYNDTLAESLGERHLADGRAILSVGYEF